MRLYSQNDLATNHEEAPKAGAMLNGAQYTEHADPKMICDAADVRYRYG